MINPQEDEINIVADANIAHLDDYFNADILGKPVNLLKLAGRDITADILHQHQADALLIRSVTQVNASLLHAGRNFDSQNDNIQSNNIRSNNAQSNNAQNGHNQRLKFVGSATIGTDHVDQAYLQKHNITFANAVGCSKRSVAQYVMTTILTLHPEYHRQPIKLGIIGLGNIGSSLAEYAKQLDWQILGYDPLLVDVDADSNTSFQAIRSIHTDNNNNNVLNNNFLKNSLFNNSSLSEVLTHSDVVSLHVPLTDQQDSPYPTHYLLNAETLAMMPDSTLLINTSRGPVINEQALLADMTKTGRQVVLDVFEHEPIVSAELLKKLAIATPHIAGYTLEGKLRGTQMIYQGFCQCFGLSVNQHMHNLLPANPLAFTELTELLNTSNLQPSNKLQQTLKRLYDIEADDENLRNLVNQATQQVDGKAFDDLRKRYRLRREWL